RAGAAAARHLRSLPPPGMIRRASWLALMAAVAAGVWLTLPPRPRPPGPVPAPLAAPGRGVIPVHSRRPACRRPAAAGARAAARPAATLRRLLDRPDLEIRRWDALTARRRVVAVAGSDAHARVAINDQNDPPRTRVQLPLPGYGPVFRAFSIALPDLTLSGRPD